MRLLNARTVVVEDFSAKQVPPYAILSHTWEDGEVTLQDMERQAASAKAGYAKIRDSCEQTLRDKLEYISVDTCCIDKTSSAELSEAINAMFRWYQDSTMCYAFLSDVPSDTNFDESSPFATSRWFTRGWTLQELLAPAKLDFYSNSWDHLGSKADLGKAISSIARIDEAFLRGRPIIEASIAARMSWAARRETSREEDRSYSLLGLFEVHIPLLYGEGGRNAFFLLQEELIRKSDDQSIFAWHSFNSTRQPLFWDFQPNTRNSSVLADSPSDFWNCSNIVTCNPIEGTLPYVLSNAGIQMKLPIVFKYEGTPPKRRAYVILWCRPEADYCNILTLPVLIEGDRCGRAFPVMRLVDRKEAISRSFNRKLYLETRQDHHATARSSYLEGRQASVFMLRSLPAGYRVESV
ncbi:het domain protein [Colletotrichum kahawae]|uniref:Het domain protein n=1 Tax=Colletotrichum kahawae TaxID=34407 RepID=A0AAD9YIB5_COLKA|nr:het domain protein [Colletotrichum kahawae]